MSTTNTSTSTVTDSRSDATKTEAEAEAEAVWTRMNHMVKMNRDSLGEQFEQWAETYDKDLAAVKYVGHRVGASKLAELITDKNARILDCGCGTGLVGHELQKLGYSNLVGVDYSPKMIETAEQKGHYRSLHVANLMTQKLPFEQDAFDAIICVGTFCPGHVDQTAFPEFIRVVKPGGIILNVMRESYTITGAEFNDCKLDVDILRRVEARQWLYLYRLRVPDHVEGHSGLVFALQVC